MNNIYKVIWNASLAIWIAVSELAKGHSKSQNNTLLSVAKPVDSLKTIKTPAAHFKYHALLQGILLLSGYSVSTAQYAGVSLGVGSNGSGTNALAIGSNLNPGSSPTVASANSAIAIGASVLASGVSTVALGSLSRATLANAVALGAFSTTASNASNIASVSQNNLNYDQFAGQVTDTGRQVSVGYAGFERQIKHVGSGAIALDSTDAINGSQLFATNAVLGNSANSQKSLLGGDAALASNGTLSMSNIGGTGKNTINDAILAARNKATSGHNIVATPTLEADGSTSYQISTDVDLTELNSVETVDGSKKTTMTASSTVIKDGAEISTLTAKGSNVTDGTYSSLYGANGLSINCTDVVLNSNGLNIGGVSLSKTGIDANHQKITNVADGSVTASSKDAINGGQLFTALQTSTIGTQTTVNNLGTDIAKSFGGNAAYDTATGVWTAPSYTVTTDPNALTTTTVNNVGDALTGLNSAVNTPLTFNGDSGSSVHKLGSSFDLKGDTNITTAVGQGEVQIKLNPDLKALNSVETVDINHGLKTTMTAAMTRIEDGGNSTILSALGSSVNNANNVSLYTANGLNIFTANQYTLLASLNASGLDVGGVTVTKEGINANHQGITNLANGQIASDAVNKGQLDTAISNLLGEFNEGDIGLRNTLTVLSKGVANSFGGGARYDEVNQTWIAPSYTVTTDPNALTTTTVNNVGDALTGLNSAVNTPLTFNGDSGSSVHKLGSSFDLKGDTNITTAVSQGEVQIKLNPDLTALNSVETVDGSKKTTMTASSTVITDGAEINTLTAKGSNVTDGTYRTLYGANGLSINGTDVVLNASGLDVGGVRISKNGIDANQQGINHLASGVLDSDATNLGQVKSLIHDSSSSVVDLGFGLKADDQQIVTKKLAEAIDVRGDGLNISTKIDNNQLLIQLADQLNVASINAGGSLLNAMGLTVGNSHVNANGLFIMNGPSLSNTGIDAGNKVISNVANATLASDAVNKGQLDTAINDIKNNVNHLSAGSVQYDKNPDGSVNNNSITLAGSNATAIHNVADGQVLSGSKDAINGGQLADVQDNLQAQITQNTNNITNIQNQFNSGGIGLVKQNHPQDDITVAQQTGGTRVNVAGTDGHRVVTGIKDGTVAAGSSDAVTGNQLYNNYENMANSLGGGAKYDNNTWTAPSYTVGEGDSRTTVHDVGSALDALNRTDSTLSARIDTLGTQLENSFRTTNQRIDKIEKQTNAGIAAALAIEAPAYVAGKFTYAVGAAAYRGESAAGISLRRTAEKGNWSMTAGIAADSQGTPAFRIGIGGVID
ncbi:MULTISPECIES: ESPR-type extended signal peptide-containing protein [unclassified Acinetobacter]|uniref:ESPR-type extended signal peptide-containing protein n=1 Tax=unclassified Acinetobacter TaxID=196816 RepID=UPI002934E726|nr:MULTISPECIES: ESPR-type extended signal peptide-containing protein [unclassified Acinetobacter]WOE31000.1 ESPR-type extended signal peptide-containing protein [Acinetobacter sp. SAAs470]WOE39196.1 ESPR-type extended signal peptide-containing protein [Acinetobacter sp. SAAs474]